MAEVQDTLLGRRWVHAHEEDTENNMVFRPDGYALPPSRGRMSFLLREDGTFTDRAIGPTDRPEEATGTWKLEDDRHVVLSDKDTNVVRRRLDIQSVSDDRLILRKETWAG
ncbi:MAG: hypothetical protein GEU78_02515 [Actinobacteria bacterium]|nr:hypothetical protein [Actinomycetota bacterium]